MTKTILALLLLAAGTAQAQITFERRYPQQIDAFKLSTGDVKYAAYVPGTANQVRVYNQNHSLYRQFTVPLAATIEGRIDYLSDRLFNTTPDLEAMVYYFDAQDQHAQVFSETGASLLRLDSVDYVNILNPPAGTKLITYQRAYSTGGSQFSKVYALGGTRTALRTTEAPGKQTAQPYPNPTAEQVQLPYTVAAGQVGELSVTDAAGRTVARYQVDATFNHLLFDARGLRPGVYLYRVQAAGQASAAQRFVVR